MTRPGEEDCSELRALIKTRLKKRVESDRGIAGVDDPPAFHYAISGTGTEYSLPAPGVVFHGHPKWRAVAIYEFPIPGCDLKVITALGDGKELLMYDVPAADIIGGYVDAYAYEVVGDEDAAFVLFLNTRLGYWHLAIAGIVKAAYDAEAEGIFGKDGWRSWKQFATPDLLTERVTLDAYLFDRIRFSSRYAADAPAWLAQRKPPLEALAEPGDEWWRWVRGTEPLMQMGGLALVRRGRVVWARQDWIS